jgi:signal transduction histidine kinase
MFARVLVTEKEANSKEGIVATAIGPVLVSIAPVLTSKFEGPQRGYLVFSRLLAPRAEARIRDKGHLNFTLTPIPSVGSDSSTSDEAGQGTNLTTSRDTLTTSYTLHDVVGRPSYLFKVSTPREFSGIGTIALGGAIVRFLVFGLIFWGLAAWATGRIIVKPLSEMAEKMSKIAATGDLDQTLDTTRSDEIGWVADIFNRMMRELKTLRTRQLEKSYVTGMADLSAGILNNVRSALKPVSDANRAASDLVERLDTTTLAEAGRELYQGNLEGDKRLKLASYITAFADGTRIRMHDVKHHLQRIDESAQHIQNILKDHESISKWPRQSIAIDCMRLVEETSRGVTNAGDIPIDVEISHADPDLPPILGHAFILRQVIGNLLANSVDAIERAQRKCGRIHILTRLADLGDGSLVEIVVGDNGAGFTNMQADKLFERGYSTRSDRPGGFGLYWCRTTLAAMNGSIVGQSPGPGLGATFRIFLPAAPQQAREPEPDESSGSLQGAA